MSKGKIGKGLAVACAALLPPALSAEEPMSVAREAGAVVVADPAGGAVLRYQTARSADGKPAVESVGYVHPFATPKGIVLTDVAPADHPHHRGIFLAWVEMHGRKDADFWGWGQHASKDKRRIVNRSVEVQAGLAGAPDRIGFRATNAWEADGDALVDERLDAVVRRTDAGHVLDLEYTLTADADLTVAQWAFSGFAARLRKDGKLVASGPEGELKLPDPKHTEPKSDWPDAPWYDFTITLDDGKVAGLAVINHPKNPPTLWHNHRGIRLLNPCICASGPVTIKAKEPLVLRYRLVAHDGLAPVDALSRLAGEYRASPEAK